MVNRREVESWLAGPQGTAWLLTAIGSAWCGGVLLVAYRAGSTLLLAPGLALGALFCLAPLALGWRDVRLRWAGLVLLAMLAGAARCALALPTNPAPEGELRHYNLAAKSTGAPVDVRGVLGADPLPLHGVISRFRVEATKLFTNNHWIDVHGVVLAEAPRYSRVAPGDTVIVHGVLQTPDSSPDFDYAAYLLNQGIGSYMKNASLRWQESTHDMVIGNIFPSLRGDAAVLIQRQIPEPEAGLLRGILLGEQWAIADNVADNFRTLGLTYVLAISGTNMTLLAGAIYFLLRKHAGLMAYIVVAALVVIAYASFVLFSWPVWRAVVMVGLYLLGRYLGRPLTIAPLLAASAILLTLLDPLSITQLGFQLTFAAMIGVLALAPLIPRLLVDRWPPLRVLVQALALSFGVQLFVVPVFAISFGGAAVVLSLASLLIPPMLLPVMVLGLLHLLVSAVFVPLALPLAWLLWLFLRVAIEIVDLSFSLPMETLAVPEFNMAWMVGWYLALGFGLWLLYRRKVATAPRLAEVG